MKEIFRTIKFQLVLSALLCAIAPSAMAQFHSAGVFRVTLNLPVKMVVHGLNVDTIALKTLNDAAIINLALGRPLTTKINPKTEVLAGAIWFETTNTPPQSQLVVYNPTLNGQAGITVVVASLQTLQWQNAYENKVNSGFGMATGTFNATTNGSPALNGFLTSPIQGAGFGMGAHLFTVGDAHAAPVASIAIEGNFNFVYTDAKGTHTFNGIATSGTGTLSGHPIGGWQ